MPAYVLSSALAVAEISNRSADVDRPAPRHPSPQLGVNRLTPLMPIHPSRRLSRLPDGQVHKGRSHAECAGAEQCADHAAAQDEQPPCREPEHAELPQVS